MGQEIETTSFTDADSREFAKHLREETDLLVQWEREGKISGSPRTAGFEMESSQPRCYEKMNSF